MTNGDEASNKGGEAPKPAEGEALNSVVPAQRDSMVLTDEQQASVEALSKENVYTKQSKWTTFRSLPVNQKWPFFKQHFLLGTMAVVVAVVVVVSFAVTYMTKPPTPYIDIEALGMQSHSSQLDSIGKEFAEYEGIKDTRRISVQSDMSIRSNSYEDDSAKVLVRVSAGDINAFIAERKQLPMLHKRGYVSNLNDGLKPSQMSQLATAGALLDAKGKPTQERAKAVGLDLSKSSVWLGRRGMPPHCVLTLANLNSGTKYAQDFVKYLNFK